MNSQSLAGLTLALVLPLSTVSLAAESACKGQSQAGCEAASSCTWVTGYTRKDGRQVAPYCRVLPPPKAAGGKPPSPTPQAG